MLIYPCCHIHHVVLIAEDDALLKRETVPVLIPVIRNGVRIPVYNIDICF